MLEYVFLILLGVCYSSNLYSSDYLLVDFNKVTDLNRTITISESNNFAPCPCNIKPFVCDMFCCCDTECSLESINLWKSSPENICKDISDKEFFSMINCQNEDEIYYYNSKYSLVDYKYALKNMFCLFYDNSGYKGNFLKNIVDIDDTQLLSLYNSFSSKKNGLHYYLNFNTGVNLAIESERYISGDYIRVKRNNKFQLEGKVMIQGSNMIGRCERMRPLKFMVNNAPESCGQKLKLNKCASYNWKNQLLNELNFFTLPSISAPTINIEINSIYLKDFVTGEIILNKDSSFIENVSLLLNTTLLVYDSSSKFTLFEQFRNTNHTLSDTYDFKGKYCSCEYFLNEAHYSLVIDNKISSLQRILIDVFLYKSISSQCENEISIKQQFSSKFTISPNEFFYSGAPGYNIGEKLLYARNLTNETGTFLEIPSQGWMLSGSYADERCYLTNLNDTQLFSVGSGNVTNKVVQFGVDMEYTCRMRFNLEGYKSFCDNDMFGGLDIFYQLRKIDYIGIFGKSSKNHLNVSKF